MFLNSIVKLESRPRRQTLEYKNTVIINVERTFLIRNKQSIIFKQICQFLSKYLSLVHNDYISICMYEICPQVFVLFLFETSHINWRTCLFMVNNKLLVYQIVMLEIPKQQSSVGSTLALCWQHSCKSRQPNVFWDLTYVLMVGFTQVQSPQPNKPCTC